MKNIKTESETDSPNKLTQGRMRIEVIVRKLVRVLALVVLSYMAWRGVSDIITTSRTFRDMAAGIAIVGLLALYLLV